jgi:GNAT superfamily N-acetyltransferase
MTYQLVNVKHFTGGMVKAVKYIHGKWGNPKNYEFYFDTIANSTDNAGAIPQFFVMLDKSDIIGCYALLINDLVSRQDLLPWFACLYVEKLYRGNRLSEKMIEHAKVEMKKGGYSTLYLSTDHDGLYEKFGWTRIDDGYNFFGEKCRIYHLSLI